MTGSNDKLSEYMAGQYGPKPFPYVTPFTMFHELKVAEYTPQIELDSSHGLSPVYRDKITVTGDGSVTHVDGEHVVSSGATAGSTATLATQERGRYQPGITGMAGHAVRRPVAPMGDQEIWWEYGDGEDGARVGEDGAGPYVQAITHGVVGDKIRQADWNADNLSGDGGSANWSGETLDLSRMITWRVPFNNYGTGPALVEAYFMGRDGKPVYIPVHVFDNTGTGPFWEIPRLPLREHVSNGTTGGDIRLMVGGRQFSVLGRYLPNRRQTAAFAEEVAVGTAAMVPLISFRKKDLRMFLSRSVKISGVNVLSDQNIKISIILGGTLTGASFGSFDRIDPGETALEVDTSATAISGGTRLDAFMAAGGVGANSTLSGIRRLGVDLPDDAIVTLAAQAISASATVSAAYTMEEEA